jgi:hypothetical protein
VKRPRTRRVRKGSSQKGPEEVSHRSDDRIRRVISARLSDPRAPGNSMREHSRRLSKEVGSVKSSASLPIFSRLPSGAPLRRGLRIRNCFRQTGPQRKGKRMFAEPTFIVSVSGLCGFILVVEDGEVDAYTPSGDLLGVFGDRIDAAEAVLRCGVHIGRLNH